MIKVILAGAMGNMGQAMLVALDSDKDIEVVGATDVHGHGKPLSDILGRGTSLRVESSLTKLINETTPEVLVDFTNAKAAMENVTLALTAGVRPVIGSTGLTDDNIALLHRLCEEKQCGAVIAPNFALGAILMMRFAQQAARYFPNCEIIEMHHDGKLDAPSGTAAATAKMVSNVNDTKVSQDVEGFEKTIGVRGGEVCGVPVHSVRLPGLVAHQEVIFGGTGETLTIRHDSLSRESFSSGLVLAVKKVINMNRMVVGLENLLE